MPCPVCSEDCVQLRPLALLRGGGRPSSPAELSVVARPWVVRRLPVFLAADFAEGARGLVAQGWAGSLLQPLLLRFVPLRGNRALGRTVAVMSPFPLFFFPCCCCNVSGAPSNLSLHSSSHRMGDRSLSAEYMAWLLKAAAAVALLVRPPVCLTCPLPLRG